MALPLFLSPSQQQLFQALRQTLVAPTAANLWSLQRQLLAQGGEAARQAREVAGEFHSYIRDLESKIASRQASRWAAFLETSSVTSVSLEELLEEQGSCGTLLRCGLTAALELGAAAKNVQAWEIEASIVHHDVAWYLYGELWDLSLVAQPKLAAAERQALLDEIMVPVLTPDTPDPAKSALLIQLFQTVLAAHVLALFSPPEAAGPAAPGPRAGQKASRPPQRDRAAE